MICSKCGANLPDNSSFCSVCGAKQAAPVQPNMNYVPKHASTPPVWDSVQPAAPAPAPAQRPAPAPRTPAQPRKKQNYAALAKNPRILGIAGGAVALIVVIALVIGMLSGMGGPLVKIAAAANKTVKAGNFTADFEVEIDGDSVEGTVLADIDTKNRTVSMLMTLDADGEEITIGIYDGQMFGLYDYGGYVYGYTEDIEDQLDEIFDAYEETGSKDMTTLLEDLDELMYDYTGEELSDYFDLEELEKCLKTYAKTASKEKWLKENLGYEKSKDGGETLYTFEPGICDFLVASVPYFETAFEDSDMYEELMENLDDYGDDLDDEFAVELTIGVKSGYLSSLDTVVEVDGEEVEIIVELYDVNKTKLDTAELESLLEEAEDNS